MFNALLLRYMHLFLNLSSLVTFLFSDLLIIEDVPSEELEASSRGNIGANDLLIVGPGVLGRLVAEKWKQVLFF